MQILIIECFRIPVLFETLGGFGRALAILFFICLSFAGISSLIGNMEMITHTLYDFGSEYCQKYGSIHSTISDVSVVKMKVFKSVL